MKLRVTLKKSGIGSSPRQRETLKGLGLTRMQRERILNDTPAIRGMINKMSHLVDCQEING